MCPAEASIKSRGFITKGIPVCDIATPAQKRATFIRWHYNTNFVFLSLAGAHFYEWSSSSSLHQLLSPRLVQQIRNPWIIHWMCCSKVFSPSTLQIQILMDVWNLMHFNNCKLKLSSRAPLFWLFKHHFVPKNKSAYVFKAGTEKSFSCDYDKPNAFLFPVQK